AFQWTCPARWARFDRFDSQRTTTSPPFPPSPPSGPPRGIRASRRKPRQPSPPSPAWQRKNTRSMNMRNDAEKRERQASACRWLLKGEQPATTPECVRGDWCNRSDPPSRANSLDARNDEFI